MIETVQDLIQTSHKYAKSQYTPSAQRARWAKLAGQLIWYKDQILKNFSLEAMTVEMQAPDRAMAKRLHAIVKASAPVLAPKLWYGMPAYAKEGKVVCFFQDAKKFKTRYATFGFMHEANLDEGAMWPTAFALKELTAAEEARIGALVKKAVS